MWFYFATRYQNTVASYTYPMFNGTSNQVFTSNAINILLTWSIEDPVSEREIDRNNAIYNRQDNRNPYIDHPEYAMNIWGSLLATTQFNVLDATSIYPNPSNDNRINIQSEAVIENIEVIAINGQLIQQIKNPAADNNVYTVSDLPQGFYFLKLTSDKISITKKIVVN